MKREPKFEQTHSRVMSDGSFVEAMTVSSPKRLEIARKLTDPRFSHEVCLLVPVVSRLSSAHDSF